VLCAVFTNVAFLWYNVIGTVIVIAFGLIFSVVQGEESPAQRL